MKNFLLILSAVVITFGCARLSVQGPKEPIKVDITMRLDVYQHVENDIDAIEGIVSGAKDKAKPSDKHSFLSNFISLAYAEEARMNPEVEQAALRRRDRANELYSLEAKGIAGENKSGMVEARDALQATGEVKKLIDAENSDRSIIYNAVAAKNSTSVDEIQKIYAKRLQNDAPAGAPLEVLNSVSGSYEWKVK